MRLSLANTKSTKADKRANGISIQVVECFTTKGKIREEIPKIAKILKILLPTTLPKAISLLPFKAAEILTTNSGNEVPKATMVKPIIKSDTFKRRAITEAPSTNLSAPKIRATNPNTRNKI